MLILPYNREKALLYAHKWAMKRNPAYASFNGIGGDCTNFASQVVYAGSGVMNYKRVLGWYYIGSYNRTPSWTGVNFFRNFLVNNKSVGPFAKEVKIEDIELGDIIQLSFNGKGIYNHSLVVVEVGKFPDVSNIKIATHSDDRDNYSLKNYEWKEIRYLHIEGVRKW